MALTLGITYLFYARMWALLLLVPLGIYLFYFFVRQAVTRERQKFERQFQDALQSLQAQLSVGYSMENATKEVHRDLLVMYEKDALIVQEFTYMVRQLNLNITAEHAWKEFALRVQIPEVDSFVTVFVLSKRSGGDSVAIIRNAIRQIGEKADVKREIETVITGKKLEFYVMTFIPFGMIMYMRVSFPEFMGSLYGTFRGVCFMSGCLGVYLTAWAIGCRIVEIEV